MEVVRRCTEHHVDIGIGKQLVRRRIGAGEAVRKRQLAALLVNVVYAGKHKAVGFQDTLVVPATHAAVADRGNMIRFHG